MDYAAPGLQPSISATNIERLERAKNRALRIITGQVQSTPLEEVRAEAKVASYNTESRQTILRFFKKAKQAAEDHPKRQTLEADVPQRLPNRTGWRRKAKQLANNLLDELQHREPLNLSSISPWQASEAARHTVNTEVPDVSGRNDPNSEKLARSITCIRRVNADIVIYTDG